MRNKIYIVLYHAQITSEVVVKLGRYMEPFGAVKLYAVPYGPGYAPPIGVLQRLIDILVDERPHVIWLCPIRKLVDDTQNARQQDQDIANHLDMAVKNEEISSYIYSAGFIEAYTHSTAPCAGFMLTSHLCVHAFPALLPCVEAQAFGTHVLNRKLLTLRDYMIESNLRM